LFFKKNIFMVIAQSEKLFETAREFIPGGVNSPVRAFKSVGGTPLFIKKAKGAYMFDEDGNRYIELINSWGPMLLGHAHEAVIEAVTAALSDSFSFGAPSRREVEMAELICEMVPSAEKVRMVNSGTEATMSAIRLARGYTGRSKIIKFEGCYHGHGDSFLIAAGSGVATFGLPNSPGVTRGTAEDTLTAPFNDIDAVIALTDANPGNVAAIIVEPVAGNMGCILPENNFLQKLRSLCDAKGILLIFDEVMTGFRLAQGGAQELFSVMPDLTTLGKIIGGGMPVGAYCGRREIMDYVAPQGPVYQAGTLSGNPVAMAAGLATLRIIRNDKSIFEKAEKITQKITSGFLATQKKLGVQYTLNQIGSMFTQFFTKEYISNFAGAKTSDTEFFGKYFHKMLQNGVYLAPSQFESLFLSVALSEADIEQIIFANEESLKSLL
jgi:glutamate-1-semialdehyde 2,1-aminomutase